MQIPEACMQIKECVILFDRQIVVFVAECQVTMKVVA